MLDKQAEETAQLTNVQLLNIIHALIERIRNLEDAVLELAKDSNPQDEFLTSQILKVQADLYLYSKKTPFKRLDELEECLKGFIAYSQEQETDKKLKLKAQPVQGIKV